MSTNPTPRRAAAVAAVVTGLTAGGMALVRTPASADGTASAPASAPERVKDRTEDGITVARGVFFLQGEIGRRIAALPYVDLPGETLREANATEATEVAGKLLNQLHADDPAFFAEFSAEMRSGDPYRVEAALVDAAERLTGGEVVGDAGDGSGTCLVVFLVVAAASFAYVYSVNEILLINNRYVATSRVHPRTLNHERQVADLTALLATS